MNVMRRGALAAMVVGSMAGGAVGATVISAASSSAATTSTAAAPSNSTAPSNGTAPTGPPNGQAPAGQAPGGVFHSNENAAHEKGESAQREAQETAGKFPTVP
jgi:hypothetical protein